MDPSDLLDRFWAAHVDADDQRPLWDSDIEQIERWPASSVEHTTAVRRQMLDLREELEAAIPDAEAGDVPSLRTAADAATLVAASVGVGVELSYAHPLGGLHSFLFWAVNGFALVTLEHGRRYLDKLAAFPTAIDELRPRLAVATEAGRPMLASHAESAADRIDAHLASPLAEDPLLEQAPPTELGDDAATRWVGEVAAAVEEHVRPALRGLQQTLREVVVPAGRPDERCGLVHLPGGEQTYAELVEAYTMPGTTPQEVHHTGLAQLERIAEEFRTVGRAAFGTDDHGQVLARLRDDPELRHDSAASVVTEAQRLHARAAGTAPDWFARTPAADCDVRATDHGSIAFYSPPAPDGGRGGVFFFNTSDPAVWGPNLAATVFHEGIPGHHFQLALAVEAAHLHDMHRQLFLPAFGEGWGLYAERLAAEMGLYSTAVERLGMLTADAMRACRLVVDTGMHALGWSRKRAIDFMAEHTPMQPVAVEREVDRYIGTPGQATSYMMGRLEIERLRDAAAARLGEGFEVADFHEVVLSRGMVSLPALETMVQAWEGGPVR